MEEGAARNWNRKTLEAFSNAILERRDPQAFFEEAVVLIADEFGVEMCGIWERLPDDPDRLLLRAGFGWRDGLVGTAVVDARPDSQADYALAPPRAVAVENQSTEWRFERPPLLREHGVVSGLSAVIEGTDTSYGVLGVYTAHHRVLGGEDTRLIRSLAQMLAKLIELDRVSAALFLRDRAIESTHNGIIITDPRQADNPIVYVNRAFEELTGYPREEVIGKNCRFLQGEDRSQPGLDRLRNAIREQREVRVELLNSRKDGAKFWVELFISPARDEQGVLTYFVGVQNDITERKKLEEQMLQVQKMEAVGQLAGGVAHDFNTLLGTIQGYSELLLEDLPPEPSLRTSVEEIQRSAIRGAGLTRQLLTFSRRQRVNPRYLCLRSIVNGMESMVKRLVGEEIDLVLALSPRATEIYADRGHVEQIIMNLVVNSVDAMPDGGRLVLSTARNPIADSPAGESDWVALSVSDTGCGMSRETQQHLFEPFFTTKEAGKGTGLGLSTVYGIVQEAGGRILVESEIGRGTELTVLFRAAVTNSSSETTVMDVSAKSEIRGSESVFLVEDDEMFRTLLTRTLERNGYRVTAAADPIQATALHERHEEPIDLLISDVVMPGGNGVELAERLVVQHPAMKVLLMSGYADKALDKRSGAALETADFLPKPFSTVELLQRVREILERGSPTPHRQ